MHARTHAKSRMHGRTRTRSGSRCGVGRRPFAAAGEGGGGTDFYGKDKNLGHIEQPQAGQQPGVFPDRPFIPDVRVVVLRPS